MPGDYDFGGTLPRTPMTIDPSIWTQIKEGILGLGAPAPLPEQDYNDYMLTQAVGPEALAAHAAEDNSYSMHKYTPGANSMDAAIQAYEQLAARRRLQGAEAPAPFDEAMNQALAPTVFGGEKWGINPGIRPYETTDLESNAFFPAESVPFIKANEGAQMVVDYPSAESDLSVWANPAPRTSEQWLDAFAPGEGSVGPTMWDQAVWGGGGY